jgi:hypothetical protein
MSGLRFIKDEKYGLIALPNIRIDDSLPKEVQLAHDLWVTRSLPLAIDSHWRQWIGSIQADLLEKANLFLIAKGPSRDPEIIDDENEKYRTRAYHLYWGLLLTDFFHVYDHSPLSLTGATRTSGVDVRSIGHMDDPKVIPGTPIPAVGLQRVHSAATLAGAFPSLMGTKKHRRFWNIIHGFYAGITSQSTEDRLHEFVRCVEGFIYPGIGKTEKQFKSRTELFIGPRHHDLTEKLYKLRSEVEHLHDPLSLVTGSSQREKVVALFQKSYEAEAMARYCIERFLSKQNLWPHFEDDSALQQFWQLPGSNRQQLWGAQLNMDQVSKAFKKNLVRLEHIGLP